MLNQIIHFPTKYGVSLTYEQIVNVANNIRTVISEMENLMANKENNGQWNMPVYYPEPTTASNDYFFYQDTGLPSTPSLTTPPPPPPDVSMPPPTATPKKPIYRKKLAEKNSV